MPTKRVRERPRPHFIMFFRMFIRPFIFSLVLRLLAMERVIRAKVRGRKMWVIR